MSSSPSAHCTDRFRKLGLPPAPWGVRALLAVGLSACGGEDSSGPPSTPPAESSVASVVVTPAHDTIVAIGATKQLEAVARDRGGQLVGGRTFTWSTSAAGVATVSDSGLVRAVGEGWSDISATADGVTGTINLLVRVAPTTATIEGVVTSEDAVMSGLRGSRGRMRAMQSAGRTAAPDELVVTFRAEALGVPELRAGARMSPAAQARSADGIRGGLASLVSARKLQVRGVSPAVRAALVRVPRGTSAAAVAAELRANPAVLRVEGNHLVRTNDVRRAGGAAPTPVRPSDPLYANQAWHYGMIDLPRAWAIASGSSSVVVAVVDDGIRFDHPDIAANLTSDGYDFVWDQDSIPLCGGGMTSVAGDGDGPDPDPTATSIVEVDWNTGCVSGVSPAGNHGLHVAGTIGAVGNDGVGVTGVSWNVRIRPVRVLAIDDYGTDYAVAQGILYAAGLPADDGAGGTVTAPTGAPIINMSLGGGGTAILRDAVDAATAAGSLIIASAGNTGWFASCPACYPAAVSVAALDPQGGLAWYSAFEDKVDVLAPGGDVGPDEVTRSDAYGVLSTAWNYQTGQPVYASLIGTSMAAPHVSGVAALVLASHPGMSNVELRARLESTADPSPYHSIRHGLVNAYFALTGAPRRARRVFLLDDAGAVAYSAPLDASGIYRFTDLPNGKFSVFAGEDENEDGVFGRALRRWSAAGNGTGAPRVIEVDGPGADTANFALQIPIELEPNGTPKSANRVPIGGYLTARLADPSVDVDLYRVAVPVAGTYTFETAAIYGVCGLAAEAATSLELQAADGTRIELKDTHEGVDSVCARITRSLEPGTYFLRVTATAGGAGPQLVNRQYRVSARSGS